MRRSTLAMVAGLVGYGLGCASVGGLSGGGNTFVGWAAIVVANCCVLGCVVWGSRERR